MAYTVIELPITETDCMTCDVGPYTAGQCDSEIPKYTQELFVFQREQATKHMRQHIPYTLPWPDVNISQSAVTSTDLVLNTLQVEMAIM